MFFVSPFLKRFAYPLLGSTNRFRYWRQEHSDGHLSILAYHGIVPTSYKRIDPLLDGNLVTREEFRRQLEMLKSRYNVITPAQFRRSLNHLQQLPPGSVLITCDDALLNAYTDMLPVLLEMDLKCIFFATGSSCESEPQMLWYEELWLMMNEAPGKIICLTHPAGSLQAVPEDRLKRHAAWWELVKRLSPHPLAERLDFLRSLSFSLGLPSDWRVVQLRRPGFQHRFQLMKTEHLRALVKAGMTVGAHTLSHPILPMCSDERARLEIADSGAVIGQALGEPIPLFAFPFGGPGTVTDRDIALAKAAGYDCALLNAGGCVPAVPNLFGIPRAHIAADMPLGEFEAHASGFHGYLQNLMRG